MDTTPPPPLLPAFMGPLIMLTRHIKNKAQRAMPLV